MKRPKELQKTLGLMMIGAVAAWMGHSRASFAPADFGGGFQMIPQVQLQGLSGPAPFSGVPGSGVASPGYENQMNIMAILAGFRQPGSPLQYYNPYYQQIQAQMGAQTSAYPLWDGVGPLPGAFQAPWSLPKSDFDPTFKSNCSWTANYELRGCSDHPELTQQLQIVRNPRVSESRVKAKGDSGLQVDSQSSSFPPKSSSSLAI